MSAHKGVTIVATAVAIILLLILALYFATPWLMNWQLQRLAADFDCHTVSTDAERPGWRQLRIEHLQLQQCANGLAQLNIEQLQLSYSLQELVQLRRLGSLEINKLEVTFHQQPGNGDNRTSVLPPLPSQILPNLPLQSFVIKQLNLLLHTPQGRLQVAGDASLSPQNIKGKVSLNWRPENTEALTPSPLLLGFHLTAQDRFSSYLGYQQQLIYQIGGKLDIDEEIIKLQLHDKFDMAPALTWLRSWFDLNLSEELQLQGILQNSWNINIPVSRLRGSDDALTLHQSASLQLNQAQNISPLIDNLTGLARLEIDWQPDGAQWLLSPETAIDITFTPGALPMADLSTQWQLSSNRLQGKTSWSDRWLVDSDTGALQLISNNADKIRLTATLDELYLSPGALSGQLSASLPPQDMHWQNAYFSNLSAEMGALLAVQNDNISVKFKQFSRILADQLQLNSLHVEKPKLVFREPFSVTTVLAEQAWQTSAMAVNIATGPISLLDRLNANAVSGQLTLAGNTQLGQQLQGQFDAELHNMRTEQTQWGSVSLQSPLQLDFPNLSIQPNLRWPSTAPNPLQLRGKLDYQLLERRGLANILMLEIPIQRLQDIASIQSRLNQQAIKLQAGQLSLNGQLPFSLQNNQLSWSANLSAQINNADVQWQDWQLQQAETRFTGQIKDQQLTNAHFSVAVPDALGFTTLTDFTLEARFIAPEKLRLDLAEVKLLGGKVSIEPFDFDLSQQSANTMVELSNIQLAELLSIQTNRDIQATGTLAGQLPLRVRQGQVYVDNGFVSSQAPGGTLVYKPAGAAQLSTNPGMKIALNALSNFHYEQMSLDVNYQPDGQLLLDSNLKGSNPDWQNGQPIDFNIRIEQNLLKLIKALNFSNNLSKGLDQQIRQRMQQ